MENRTAISLKWSLCEYELWAMISTSTDSWLKFNLENLTLAERKVFSGQIIFMKKLWNQKKF
jgi:hypothetical protein